MYLGTVFAYGQTGTGKTYTMEGERNDKEKRGIIPNSFEHIFSHINQSENEVILHVHVHMYSEYVLYMLIGYMYIYVV